MRVRRATEVSEVWSVETANFGEWRPSVTVDMADGVVKIVFPAAFVNSSDGERAVAILELTCGVEGDSLACDRVKSVLEELRAQYHSTRDKSLEALNFSWEDMSHPKG